MKLQEVSLTARELRHYLITDGTFIFIELEDTVEELYNATVQMQRIFSIAELYEGYVVIAVPIPKVLSSLRAPIAYYFKMTSQYKLRREVWLIADHSVIKIHEYNSPPSRILEEISMTLPVKTKNRLLNPELTRKMINNLEVLLKRKH